MTKLDLDKDSVIGISALWFMQRKLTNLLDMKDLIKDFIKSYLKDANTTDVLNNAEKIESNSNQLLNYTNITKQNSVEIKNIIEHLWKVIISDVYSNHMNESCEEYVSNLFF